MVREMFKNESTKTGYVFIFYVESLEARVTVLMFFFFVKNNTNLDPTRSNSPESVQDEGGRQVMIPTVPNQDNDNRQR